MRIAILAAVLALASPAMGHSYWKTGVPVDPQTKNSCCGKNDTKELDPSTVKPMAGGFFLTDTSEFIPPERVQPSPDNAIWASRWGGTTKCFWYPYSF